MIEGMVGPAAKHGASLLTMVYRRFFPTKYGYKVAPTNILEVISPFTYEGKVFEILGQPHAKQIRPDMTCLAYRFTNALLQVNVVDDYVDSVSLVSLNLRWPNRFTIFPLNLKLGKHKFADALRMAGETSDVLSLDASTKFYIGSCKCYYGFPGRYRYYHFASVSAACFPPIPEPATDIERLSDSEGRLKNLSTAAFNGVAICRRENDHFPFEWSYFM